MRKHIHRPNAEAKLAQLQADFKKSVARPKFCKDCFWHSFRESMKPERIVYHHFCKFPPLLDVITGEPSNAAKNRNDANKCGQEARHFTARKTAGQTKD